MLAVSLPVASPKYILPVPVVLVIIASPPLPFDVLPITNPELEELSVISFTLEVPPNTKCGPLDKMRSLSVPSFLMVKLPFDSAFNP